MSDTPKWNIKQVSLKDGYWFYFVDGERKITVFGAAGSGKEVVFVNDERVSEKRSLGLKSKHRFSVDGNSYVVQLRVSNIFTGAVECVVDKNNSELERTTKAYYASGFKINPYVMFFSIVLGTVIGFWIGQNLWK